MPVKCEKQLRFKVDELTEALREANIEIRLVDITYNDYNAMLSLDQQGNIHIYYSPRNRSYKLGLHQFKDKALHPAIEACWNTITPPQPEPKESDMPRLPYQAYVDGSFQGGAVGYGLVILHEGENVHEDWGTIDKYTEQQQITGELSSTMRVIRWCEANEVRQIQIFYDYNGIEKWATGLWKASTESTQAYKNFMRQTPVKVVWQKVKSHSGDHWNDYVDELAKRGSGMGAVEGVSATETNPLMIELEKITLAFVVYLQGQGLDAEFLQIYNGMFARLTIQNGLFDLYNTKKKPLSPVLSNYNSPKIKEQVLTLWEQFRKSDAK